jgi:hypothetical protein
MNYYCETCHKGHYHFELQPHLQAHLQTEVNEAGELMIMLPAMPPFAADTAFMNHFASCQHCQGSTRWHYSTTGTVKKQHA